MLVFFLLSGPGRGSGAGGPLWHLGEVVKSRRHPTDSPQGVSASLCQHSSPQVSEAPTLHPWSDILQVSLWHLPSIIVCAAEDTPFLRLSRFCSTPRRSLLYTRNKFSLFLSEGKQHSLLRREISPCCSKGVNKMCPWESLGQSEAAWVEA